jgi:putative CRISPR-associated protein (TIGR02619 family)
MKFSRVVLTCGVSAFAPHNEFRKLAESCKGLSYAKPGQGLRPAEGFDEASALAEWRKLLDREQRFEVVDPKRVSAEYSMLNALRANAQLIADPQLQLLHTETLDARCIAALNERLLKRSFGATVTHHEVPELDATKPASLRAALGEYMRLLAKELESGTPDSLCFAPIGGYKIMTSYAFLVGALLGYPSYYLHEGAQQLFELPAPPLELDSAALREIAPLLMRIAGAAPWSELAAREQRQLEASPWLFERDDELVAANPFAHFLMRWERTASEFRPELRLAPLAQRIASTNAATRENIQRALRKLQDWSQCEALGERLPSDLHHEAEFRDWPHPDHALFKESSNGVLPIRILYRYVAQKHRLEIPRIWIEHDSYLREYANAIPNFDPETWHDLN